MEEYWEPKRDRTTSAHRDAHCSIQDEGFLVVINNDDETIYASTNIRDHIGYHVEEIIGNTMSKYILDLNTSSIRENLHGHCSARLKSKDSSILNYKIYYHMNSDGYIFVEGEEENSGDNELDLWEKFGRLFHVSNVNDDLNELLKTVARELKAFMNFDRVFILEYDESYQASVIAEETDLPSKMLGLKFPSTEINFHAKKALIQQRLRINQDCSRPKSVIYPQTTCLDMSGCFLKWSSHYHLPQLYSAGESYISMSIVIGSEPKLWGVIIGHNYHNPTHIPFTKRRYLQMMGKLVSMQVENLTSKNEFRQRLSKQSKLSDIRTAFEDIDLRIPWKKTIHSVIPRIVDTLDSHGAIFHHNDAGNLGDSNAGDDIDEDDNFKKHGQLSENAFRIHQQTREKRENENLFFTANAGRDLGFDCLNGQSCGVLYFKIQHPLEPPSGIHIFRDEIPFEIFWQAESKKRKLDEVLTNSESFERCKEIRKGHSKSWEESTIHCSMQIQLMIDSYLNRWSAFQLKDQIKQCQEEQRELLQLQFTSKQSMFTQTSFLATISHELRTPLHSILGNTERLFGIIKPDDSVSQSCCYNVQKSGEQLLSIITNILDFTKLESNKLEIIKSPVYLQRKIDALVESFFEEAVAKNLSLVLLSPVDLPSQFITDGTRLIQVLYNYLNNAIKFTESGGITITVDIVSCDKTTKEATLRFGIVDSGIGIPKEDIERLYDKYHHRQNNSDNFPTRIKNFEGSGLGLAINKHLVKLMGGKIGVESKLGQGSYFWTTLTLKTPEWNSPPSATIPENIREGNILVFESRPFVKNFVDHYMKQWQANSVIFFDLYSSAIDYCVRGFKSLKVVIFGLSEKNNENTIAAADILKAKFPNIVVIFVDSIPSCNFTHKDYNRVLKHPMNFTNFHELITQENIILVPKITEKNFSLKKSLSILVAEDNRINQIIIHNYMKGLPYDVDFVDNGMLAVRAVQNKSYDIAFMDIMMPVMDGITATIQIRNYEKLNGNHLVVVAMTAASESSLIEECTKAGMDLEFSKPFKREDLLNILARCEEICESRNLNRSFESLLMNGKN